MLYLKGSHTKLEVKHWYEELLRMVGQCCHLLSTRHTAPLMWREQMSISPLSFFLWGLLCQVSCADGWGAVMRERRQAGQRTCRQRCRLLCCPVDWYAVWYCWHVNKGFAPVQAGRRWGQKIKKKKRKKEKDKRRKKESGADATVTSAIYCWHAVSHSQTYLHSSASALWLACERHWGRVMNGGRQGEARPVVLTKPRGWVIGSLITKRILCGENVRFLRTYLKHLGFFLKAYMQWRKINPS